MILKIKILLFIIMNIPVFSQNMVYYTNHAGEANWDVCFVDNPLFADVVINEVYSQYELRSYDNSWMTVSTRHRATLIVRVVDHPHYSRKTLRVYKNSPRRQILPRKWIDRYQKYFE